MSKSSDPCPNPKLSGSNSVCIQKCKDDFYFGKQDPDARIQEYVLRNNKTNKEFQLMFSTRVKDPNNSRKYLRRLCLRKLDPDKNYYYKDITDDSNLVRSLGAKRNVKLVVEILEDRPVGPYGASRIVPFTQVNSTNKYAPTVLSKIPFDQLDDDGVNLPLNLNSRFYIKIYAKGSPNRERLFRMNSTFYIDYAGEIENESESIAGTKLEPGTSKVLFGNRN
tara:strand:- start:596 stop:1261 length:666 start_codon:yes stop_codon:yes gene_type:complete